MAKQHDPHTNDALPAAGGAEGQDAPPVQRRRGVGVHLGLEEAARALLGEAGEKLVDPAAIARAVGGERPEGWGPLMQPLRLALVKLARDGSVTIYRKGKPADPEHFKGLYRVGRGPAFGEWEI